MSESMRIVDTSPDAYLASLPDEHRESLTSVDSTIHRALPNRRRVLWQGVFWGGHTSQSLDTATSTKQVHLEMPSSGSSSASLARRGTSAST